MFVYVAFPVLFTCGEAKGSTELWELLFLLCVCVWGGVEIQPPWLSCHPISEIIRRFSWQLCHYYFITAAGHWTEYVLVSKGACAKAPTEEEEEDQTSPPFSPVLSPREWTLKLSAAIYGTPRHKSIILPLPLFSCKRRPKRDRPTGEIKTSRLWGESLVGKFAKSICVCRKRVWLSHICWEEEHLFVICPSSRGRERDRRI